MRTKAFMVNMNPEPIKHLPCVVRTRSLHSRHQHLSMGPDLFSKSARCETKLSHTHPTPSRTLSSSWRSWTQGKQAAQFNMRGAGGMQA